MSEIEKLINAAESMTPDEIHRHPMAAVDKLRALARELRAARAGVVAEEPEWEQRYEHLKKFAAVAMVTLNGDPYGYRSPSNREAAEVLASGLGVPVKQEGAGQ